MNGQRYLAGHAVAPTWRVRESYIVNIDLLLSQRNLNPLQLALSPLLSPLSRAPARQYIDVVQVFWPHLPHTSTTLVTSMYTPGLYARTAVC